MRRLAVVLVALVALTACGKSAAQKAADANAAAVLACKAQTRPFDKILNDINTKLVSGSGYNVSDYAPIVGQAATVSDDLQSKVSAGEVTMSCQTQVIAYLTKALADHASASAVWVACDPNPKCSQKEGSAVYNKRNNAWLDAEAQLSTADSNYPDVKASATSEVSSVSTAMVGASIAAAKAAVSEKQVVAKAEAKAEAEQAKLQAEQSTIVFKITSTSGVASSVTYNEGDGNIEQDTSASLPWRKSFDDPGSGLMQLSAQNGGGGSITCTIEDAAGDVFDQHTSNGPYAIADCQYDEGVQ